MSVGRPRLAVFCRAPRPGRTKTRLIPGLGEAGAAAFSIALLLDLAARLDAPGWDRELWVADERDRGPIGALAGDARVRVQTGADLGERMLSCIAAGAEAGRPATVIVGSDCPGIDPETVEAALLALDDADAVICPSGDGGYGLVAARRALPPLFAGIDWGTPEVCEQTRTAAVRTGIRLAEPCAVDDVDRPDDLARLAGDLAATGNPTALGRTRAILGTVDGVCPD